VRRWFFHALTGRITLQLLCLISVVSCLPPSGSDNAAVSDAASGADSPALTAEDVILNEDVASVSANQLLFPKFREGYLKESGLRAIIDIEFRSGAPFPLKKFGVAMNGGLGHYPEAFDLNRVSRWNNGHLQVEVGKLAFEGDRTFFQQALRVQTHRGRVILWLLSPSCTIQRAKIMWVRERPSRAPAGLMSVSWDEVPPVQSDRRAVEFKFHSPEGTPLFFECSKDKQAFHRCESPKSFNKLGVGFHVFYARAVDSLKRRGPYLAYSFEIIKASNSVVIQRAEPTDSPTSSDTLKIWFTSASTLSSKQSLACQLDGGGFGACASPHTFSGLAEGWHEASIQIKKNGKLTGTPARYAWYVDKTAPEVQFQDAPSPLTSQTSARFTWIVSEESAFRCRLDEGSEADCVTPLEVNGLAGGAHRLTLQARDEAGNASQLLEYAWTIDAQAPRLSLDSVLPAESVSSSENFRATFSSDEPALFQCRLDQENYEGCVSPFTAQSLSEGDHELEISAVDLAGNISEAILYRWSVDTTRPQVNIEWSGQTPTNQTSATFRFQSTDAVRFYCDINGGGAALCASPATFSGFGEGDHQLIVTGVDAAGNASEPASFAWRVDLTAPRLVLGRVEPADSRTSSRTLSLAFEADEAGFTQCELDGAGVAACVSPVSLSGLADGEHRYSVVSRDAAGNVSAPLVYEWQVESIPSVAIQGASPAEPVTSQTQIAITFSANLPATFECRLDSEAFQVCVSPWLREGLVSGAHSAEIRALNDLGTAGASVYYHWEIDAAAPVLEWLGANPPEALTRSRTMSFSFSSENGATFLCRLDGGAEAACDSPVDLADIQDGPHDFVVTAKDGLGNRSAPYAYHWEVDATAPVISSVSRLPASEILKVREAVIAFSASEEVSFSCVVDGRSSEECASPLALAALADGSHTVQIVARDNAGNESAPASLTFKVDATAPTVTLLYRNPSEALTNSRQAEIGFSSNEAVTFQCAVDGAASVNCASPFTLNALGDGEHRVEIRAVDTAGNLSEAVASQWQVDASAPSVILLSRLPSGELTANGQLLVTFAANEPAQFFCQVDGGASAPCASPFSANGLIDGNHTFQVLARDSAGNEGQAVSFGWAIDTVRPSMTGLTREPSPPVVKQKAVTLQWSGSESGTYHCSLDGAPAQPCSSPVTLNELSEGGHQFAVRLTDAAGNVSDAVSASWSVDTIAPSIQGYSRNPSEDPSNSRAFVLHFSANEPGSTFFCALDGAAFAPCADPNGVQALVDGSHRFQVYARDAAGNDGTPFTDVWVVDGTAPAMNLDGRTPAGALVRARNVAISFSANDPAASLFCSLDGQNFAPCVSPFSAQNLIDGNHNFQVYARDLAGNQSASAADNWTVDTVAPLVLSLSRSPVGNLIAMKAVTFTFGSNEGGATFFCAVDGGASQACSSPYALSNLSEGNHSFQVFARDMAGNQGEAVSDTFTVDTQVPVVSLSSRVPAGNLVVSNSVSIAFSANEVGASFYCSLDGATATTCASPFSATALADGNHAFRVYARDAAGNQSTLLSESWTVDATAPVVSLTSRSPAGTLLTVKSVSLSFSSADPNASFFCSLDGQAAAACASPYVASNLADGNHAFQVYARDLAGNQSATVSDSWAVDATAPVVSLSSRTPAGTLLTVRNVSIAFQANDVGASFYCSLDGQAAALCSSPFVANNLADGAHSFQVYAKDGANNQSNVVSDAFTIDATVPTVSLGARVPAGNVVTSKSVSISFSSPDGAASLYCSLDGQSAALCQSPFTAGSLAEGNHGFQVFARDAAGNQSVTVSDTWAIDSIAPSASLVSRTPAGALVNASSVSLAFNSNDAGAQFFCSFDGQAAASCTSPYTASGLSEGNHSFQVFARDAAGNQSATVSDSWAVDTLAPQIVWGAVAPNYSPSIATSKSIAFGATEGATFFCSVDGANFSQCASPYNGNGLANGAHSFAVRAIDAAGNLGVAASQTWEVNTAALTTSNVAITAITQNTAQVGWITSVPANSRVIYGTGGNLNLSTTLDPANIASHVVVLNGLARFTLYSVQTISVDADGRETRSTVRTFRTSN